MNLWQKNLFAFTDLAMRVVEKKPFTSGGHAELICEVLQDVSKKKIKNILITMPPAHSKTFIVSNGLIPFIVGHDPSCRTFYVSNKHDLAVKKTGEIKKLLTSQVYKDLFPKLQLAKKGEERMTFVNARGYIEAKGLMSDITGDNADLIVLDDPIDASATKVEVETAKNKIRNSILNRLRPEADGDNYGFIVINQRTGEEDISHFFLENYKLGYHINLPFLEETRKVYTYNSITLIREPNVPLNPALITKDFVKQAIGDFDISDTAKRIFETQYQQNPQPQVGQIMKLSHFRFYAPEMLANVRMKKIFLTLDSATKTKEANDYSVMCCWGVYDSQLWLLDMIRGKWEFQELHNQFLNFYKKWQKGLFGKGVGCNQIIVEDASSGTQLIQSYKKMFPSFAIKPLKRVNDKFTRYVAVGRFIETGQVFLPSNQVQIDGVLNTHTSITEPFLKECIAFTSNDTHKHDDIVDNLIDACTEAFLEKESFLEIMNRDVSY
jgi:predicted phage terminase large subunit-like protein